MLKKILKFFYFLKFFFNVPLWDVKKQLVNVPLCMENIYSKEISNLIPLWLENVLKIFKGPLSQWNFEQNIVNIPLSGNH